MTASPSDLPKAPRKRASPKEVKGKLNVVHLRDRTTIGQICERSGIDRLTVNKYLAMEGAPQPDEKRCLSYREVIAWLEANSTRAQTPNNIEMRKLKEATMRIQAESAAWELGVKQGKYIELAKLEPSLAAFCAQFTSDVRAKFEFELPQKYDGKNLIERRKLNADAIDWILRRLKDGADGLEGRAK